MCSHILGTVRYFESYIIQVRTINAACRACCCQLGMIIKYQFSSRVRNDTNTAGVYQFSTLTRNNTNARYSPLEAVDINPRLKRETMDNT